jgi:hypothetical protein
MTRPNSFGPPLAIVVASLPAGALLAADEFAAFDTAQIYVEQNATDGDTEVVMAATGGDDGLRLLRVRAPDGRIVLSVGSRDPGILGLREFLFESPEPPNDEILDAYPEGTYVFHGSTHGGERLRGRAELSHALPPPTFITHPPAGGVVPPRSLIIEWTAVPGVREYVLELENESVDPEQALTINLRPDVTHFEVPEALLVPESDYQVGIGSVAANGNVVFVENVFATGPRAP